MDMVYFGMLVISLWVFVSVIVSLIRSHGFEIQEKVSLPWEKAEKRAAKKAAKEAERARREFWGVSR